MTSFFREVSLTPFFPFFPDKSRAPYFDTVFLALLSIFNIRPYINEKVGTNILYP